MTIHFDMIMLHKFLLRTMSNMMQSVLIIFLMRHYYIKHKNGIKVHFLINHLFDLSLSFLFRPFLSWQQQTGLQRPKTYGNPLVVQAPWVPGYPAGLGGQAVPPRV